MHFFQMLRHLLSGGVLSLLAVASTFAQTTPKARIDFLLLDGLELTVTGISEGGESRNSVWDGKQSLVCTFPSSAEWQTASVTVLPSQDGRVVILPMSERQPVASPVFILYEKIEASDDSLKNGDFKRINQEGVPIGWTLSSFAQDERNTASVTGKGIRVWHDSRYVQTLDLQADTPITFTFHYRAD